jgi:mitochondrial fission protein ELM1
MIRCEHDMMDINISREGPTLVVACGWDTISYSSLIRRLAPDNVFVIQVVFKPNLLTFTVIC